MTPSPDSREARVIVTQADRDAAVDIASAWANSRIYGGDVRAGKHDDDPVVQLAARHRLATAEQQRIVPGEGPQPVPSPGLSCTGCAYLKTKWWKDHLDNDETDSGTSARCGAIPNEHGGKSITAYWSDGAAPPTWCPYLAALSPDTTQTKGGALQPDEVMK